MSTDLPSAPADLPALAAGINASHAAAESAARSAIGHALTAGEMLARAKAAVGHGGWLPWVRDNVAFAPRTAQAYMRLHARRAELGADAQRVAHLPIREALRLLADPREDKGDDEPARPAEPTTGALTPAQRARLAECEAAIRTGLDKMRADRAKTLETLDRLKAEQFGGDARRFDAFMVHEFGVDHATFKAHADEFGIPIEPAGL